MFLRATATDFPLRPDGRGLDSNTSVRGPRPQNRASDRGENHPNGWFVASKAGNGAGLWMSTGKRTGSGQDRVLAPCRIGRGKRCAGRLHLEAATSANAAQCSTGPNDPSAAALRGLPTLGQTAFKDRRQLPDDGDDQRLARLGLIHRECHRIQVHPVPAQRDDLGKAYPSVRPATQRVAGDRAPPPFSIPRCQRRSTPTAARWGGDAGGRAAGKSSSSSRPTACRSRPHSQVLSEWTVLRRP